MPEPRSLKRRLSDLLATGMIVLILLGAALSLATASIGPFLVAFVLGSTVISLLSSDHVEYPAASSLPEQNAALGSEPGSLSPAERNEPHA